MRLTNLVIIKAHPKKYFVIDTIKLKIKTIRCQVFLTPNTPKSSSLGFSTQFQLAEPDIKLNYLVKMYLCAIITFRGKKIRASFSLTKVVENTKIYKIVIHRTQSCQNVPLCSAF